MEYSMKVTESEMHEALQRSGYILESVTEKNLAEWGFFVQTGQVVEDLITGKGRDIDIIANSISNHNHYSDIRTISQIEYVFEVKNNLYPIVLLTKLNNKLNNKLNKKLNKTPKVIKHPITAQLQGRSAPPLLTY
jgi:hypothetical protein